MTANDQVDAVRVVRKRAEHNVSRKHIDPDALTVLYRLMRNGFTAYLVGGGVRDLLLGQKPKDFDIATSAHPRQIRKLFRNSFLIGRRFRLVHIRFGNNVIETSTFRRRPDETTAGGEAESLFQESDNTFGTPEEDAWRRDFTINALFYDIRTYAIIDHVGGLNDLEAKLIRSIGNSDERFQEDPVRMVRAVRFAARLNFRIERETYQAITRHYEGLSQASAPRLLEEIYKLFTYGAGEPAFRLLRRTRLLVTLFPELEAFLTRGAQETTLFWRHMAALDQRWHETGSNPPPPLIFGTLLLAPFLEALRVERRQQDYTRYAATARALIEPLAVRFRMPKRVVISTLQLLDGQHRFDAGGRGFSRRFAVHDVFGELIGLRRVHLLATGGDLTTLDKWLALRDDAVSSQPPPPEGGLRPRRPRRRRRRGPRSSDVAPEAAGLAVPADDAPVSAEWPEERVETGQEPEGPVQDP